MELFFFFFFYTNVNILCVFLCGLKKRITFAQNIQQCAICITYDRIKNESQVSRRCPPAFRKDGGGEHYNERYRPRFEKR